VVINSWTLPVQSHRGDHITDMTERAIIWFNQVWSRIKFRIAIKFRNHL